MKLLSIIIPHFTESEQQVFPLLSSINFQKGIDLSQVEIIIVNDNGKSLSHEFLELFNNLQINHIQLDKNVGSGLARQRGLEIAKSKYIMFCDCDDLLHNVGVLSAMIEEIENNQSEFLSTDWLEEIGDNTFFNHEMEQTWLHGKMFLRLFLEINDINFHNDLRVHEDTYFLKLVTSLTNKRIHLNLISYVWTFNPNSITRIDNAIYGFDKMDVFILSVIEASKKLNSNMEEHICQLVIYIYLLSQSQIWQDSEYLNKMLDALTREMANMWCYWDNATDELKHEIYSNENNKCIPSIGLNEFVNSVRKE